MGDLLDRFGLIEFFAYLCPGVISLLSLLLWVHPNPSAFVGPNLAKEPFILSALLLIVAYALGLIMAWLGSAGSNRYVRISDELKVYRQHNIGRKSRKRRLMVEVPVMGRRRKYRVTGSSG